METAFLAVAAVLYAVMALIGVVIAVTLAVDLARKVKGGKK